MNEQMIELNDELEVVEVVTEIDLFSEELEDHFNAALGSTVSTASTACGCFSTASCFCTAL